MDRYALVCGVALAASLLTLFSGFGLGTLLLPAFAAFFPAPLAVAMTGVVHLLNNLFKLALVGRRADAGVVRRFGVPAVAGALAGALALAVLGDRPPLAAYRALGRDAEVTLIGLVVGVLIVVFGVGEALPAARRLTFGRRWLPLGGLLSGFFGGLSGHQGALRTAFLSRLGLPPPAFVGTGVVVACMVDVTRLGTYAAGARLGGLTAQWPLVAAATAAAFAGAYAGSRWLGKTSVAALRWIVGGALALFGAAMAAGLV